MQRRREIIGMKKDFNILYEAYNLSFNGTASTVINTGIYLFTAENINRDFELTAENIGGENQANYTIICAKHNGNAYGFLVRTSNKTGTSYKGTVNIYPTPNNIVIKRINGVITLSGTNISNPTVQFINEVFNWPLVLGCAVDDEGNYFRYKTGTIGHILVRWL